MLGRHNRFPSPRNLSVYYFCLGCTDERGKLPKWAELMSTWNRFHPNEQYYDVRTFARDYRRAEKHTAFPAYAEPW